MNPAAHMSHCRHVLRFASQSNLLSKPSQSFRARLHTTSKRRQIGVGIGFDSPRDFKPLIPPSPSSLPPPRPPKQYPRLIKWGRRFLYISAFGGTIYLADRVFNYSAFTRSLRTINAALIMTADYYWNFKESKGNKIGQLHLRSANRVYDILSANGGLYLKVGQAIAMQAAVLPPAFQQKFAKLFDDAPQVSYKAVLKVFKEEYGGKTPDEVFMPGSFEHKAVASASIAQVHRARLKDGTPVAVKIQKPQIATWIKWDLQTWSLLMWAESKFFDINFYFVVPYIKERLQSECDFTIEADNSERTRRSVMAEPSLRDSVYVPKVFTEMSTKRVMVAEWIDGVKLWDKEAISGPWRGADMVGKPIGRRRKSKENQSIGQEFTSLFESSDKVQKDLTVKRAGLGLSLSDVMTTIVRLFACQMFYWGHVHCDPHPGNMFVRRKPNGKPEVVLIDHGLYVDMSEEMRRNYCEFWTALLTFDNKKIAEVAEKWGIGNTDMFASATLMRPYAGGDQSFAKTLTGDDASGEFDRNKAMKEAMKKFLNDTDKIPKELMFLGRSMRIIQGNNQLMGSPVNRIKETALAASKGLLITQTRTEHKTILSWGDTFRAYWRYAIFRMVMLSSDIIFLTVRLRQKLKLGEGFEDELEKKMRAMAKSDFGVDLNSSPFEG